MRLRSILTAGILIRVALMPFTAHPFDVYVWHRLILGIVEGPTSVKFFPPMLFYTLVPVAFTYEWASGVLGASPIPLRSLPEILNPDPRYGIQYITDPSFNTLVKIPFLVADVLATVAIFKLIENLSRDKSEASWAAAVWFLNPYLILISAVWGMFDSLPTLFSIVSMWLLLRRRLDLSAFAMGVAAAYKLYPAVFLFPTVIFTLNSDLSASRRAVLRYILVFTASTFILFLPAISQSLSFSQGLLTGPPDPGAAGFGLTFWSVLLILPSNPDFVIATSNLIVITFLAATYLQAFRRRADSGPLSLAAFQLCSILSIFAGFRFVCEQFLVWALPYMVILAVAGKVKTREYWSLSSIALAYSLIHGLNGIFFLLPAWPWLGGLLLSVTRLVRGPVAADSGYGYELVSQPHLSPVTLTLTVLGSAFTLIVAAIWKRLALNRAPDTFQSLNMRGL
ncbi:DUF2029 domain-containing protein [Candidatus Bathyarchaeota archaeon]|nr:DUF2029 domain-containing protein [Candidatus Bathyarchaeota archaeon]